MLVLTSTILNSCTMNLVMILNCLTKKLVFVQLKIKKDNPWRSRIEMTIKGTKIQPSKEADMPGPPYKQSLIQDSAPTGTPSSSKEKKYQEPYYDETGRKAIAASRKPAGYYSEASSPRGGGVVGGHESFKFFCRSRWSGIR
jgi:hypothetical protein